MHTRSSQRRHPGLLAAALLSLVTAGACGSDPDTGGSGGSGGTGGAGGSGGRGGAGGSGGSGGASGSGGSGGATGGGGSSTTGGVGGGSGGSGGAAGSGGSGGAGGVGGGGSGGAAGSGGSGGTGGSGGAGGSTQDARMETGADVPAGGTIESCFANLRAGMGSYQVGTKTSADGKVRYRLALETADRFGTSGTKPWGAYRFAIETPNVSVCVTQSGLFNAYKTTHHNCMDTFEVTAQGRRYVIEAPDFDGNRAARVSVSEGSLILSDKVQVLPTACTGSTTPCRSGGPC